MHPLSLLSYVTILGSVVAAPAGGIDIDTTSLVKRAESIHIVWCTPLPGEGSNSIPPFSAAVYCPNDSACQLPTSNNVCKIDPSQLGVGGPFSCKFPSGVTFTWNLSYEAGTAPKYSQVGGGTNGFKKFTGYKDDGHSFCSIGSYSCVTNYYFL
ncbi:uncharacterized protein TRIVIDRAFT_164142 [Trichoderma virens Gv29-8]|uniref:Ig-like domain-containing protein n=1 Tax=Hypocrea virens (strain Gv29-8 / FGSC 10586) TaxID=413071 RepID=G9NBY2_HYPVG|nr:uncharacterized protein TRIVIDRAFT_164142 [Trichoderma virens Gv29-8]EHK16335.1 hypothetical protein TRIVIDRAFT_164142 [Trichoderma virens Gv29-8]UKZ55890.1 hypothetical protein TrVGV298_009714 [Trichoderma virens]